MSAQSGAQQRLPALLVVSSNQRPPFHPKSQIQSETSCDAVYRAMGMEGAAANRSWMSRAAQRDGILSRVLWYEPALLREALEDPLRHFGHAEGRMRAGEGVVG